MADVEIPCSQCGASNKLELDPKTNKPRTFMLTRYDESLKRPLNRGQKLTAITCQKCGHVALFDQKKFNARAV
ncbi:MAG: hypothetical protein ACE5KG_04545, partial [Nitrososphaerales archaeon]